MSGATCIFCGVAATLIASEECRTCRGCANRIARIAGSESASDVWDIPPRPSNVDDEMRELAERVASELSDADGESHFHLAAVYRETGMYANAVRAAALAIEGAANDAKATAALRMLVTEPLLRDDGLTQLRKRIARSLMN